MNVAFHAQKLREVNGVALRLDQLDGFVNQRHPVLKPSAVCECASEHDMKPRRESPIARRMELLQTTLQHLDPGLDVAAADGEFALEAMTEVEIGLEILRLGTGDKPIQVLLGSAEIADPQ